MPSVIDLGNLLPKMITVRRVLLSTPVPVSLRCDSDLITIEPSNLGAGRTWVHLQVKSHVLDDGTLLFTSIHILGGSQEKQIIIRGFIKAGSVANLPVIRVPQDANTLLEAYALADSGDCILIDAGIWEGGLVIDKPVVLRSAPGAHVVLRGAGQPALTVRAHVVLENISLVGENAESALVCECGSLRMTGGGITCPDGDGLRLAGQNRSQLRDVEISNCRGAGLQLQGQSSATVSSCQLHHNRQSNLKSEPETRIEAVRSGFQRSRIGSGIWAQGYVSLKDCSVFGNAHFGLYLESNATALVQGGTFDQNGKGSVRASGTSSITLDKVRFPSGTEVQNVASDPTAVVATIL